MGSKNVSKNIQLRKRQNFVSKNALVYGGKSAFIILKNSNMDLYFGTRPLKTLTHIMGWRQYKFI